MTATTADGTPPGTRPDDRPDDLPTILRLSPNFHRREFACKCGCGFDTVDATLVRCLEDLRARLGGRPMKVHSGCRCPAHNAASGGSPNSQHLIGRAADVTISGISPSKVHAAVLDVLAPFGGGAGAYSRFTHIDVRSKGPARWQGT